MTQQTDQSEPTDTAAETEAPAAAADASAHWTPLVAGILMLVLATVLTWVALDRAALFSHEVNVVERAKAAGNLGKVRVAQPQPMDLAIARWAAVGVAMIAVVAGVLAVRTKRLATVIVLIICVVLFFFTVLAGVFTL